jgi:hypothetical protein
MILFDGFITALKEQHTLAQGIALGKKGLQKTKRPVRA